MQEFLIIIISLALGYWQGLKKRNKKHKVKIQEYEMTISSLKDEISKLNRRMRLQQYNNGSLKKKNKDRLETELTSFITTSSDNYVLCANTYCILNMVYKTNQKQDSSFMEKEFIVDQADKDITDYIEQSEYEDDNVDLIVEYKKGIRRLVSSYDAYGSFKEWIDKFNIDIYAVTRKELIDTLHFILYEMNFDEKD